MIDLWCALALVGLPFFAARARLRLSLLVAGKLGLIALAAWALQLPLMLAAVLAVPLATVGFAAGFLVPRGGVRLPLGAALLAVATATLISPRERHEEVTTAIRVERPAASVWNRLKAFGSLRSTPTGLLAWGLPVPRRCELQHEGLGGRRTCYFDPGRIEQRITRWEPPARMDLEIVDSDLPFQPFRFTGASYFLTPSGQATEVVRTTSLSSRLSPAWFWRPLERRTVAAEHQYLLGDLAL